MSPNEVAGFGPIEAGVVVGELLFKLAKLELLPANEKWLPPIDSDERMLLWKGDVERELDLFVSIFRGQPFEDVMGRDEKNPQSYVHHAVNLMFGMQVREGIFFDIFQRRGRDPIRTGIALAYTTYTRSSFAKELGSSFPRKVVSLARSLSNNFRL